VEQQLADDRVEKELTADLSRFEVAADRDRLRRSIAVGLTLRDWAEREQLDALTVNFLDIDSRRNFPCMPFLEASKAMSRGLGYAGEGDVLTAAFVGALIRSGLRATFSEMFCPDWSADHVFLSHMGEANTRCLEQLARIVDKPFPFSDAEDTVAVAGRFVAGEASLVDLAPICRPDGSVHFRMVIVPGQVVAPDGRDNMADLIRGWFAPHGSVSAMLSAYSRAAGTHHLALVYGDCLGTVSTMADVLGWEIERIGEPNG
jgi:L-arabinose isomerase